VSGEFNVNQQFYFDLKFKVTTYLNSARLPSNFDATAAMALPLRCAASLGLADPWPI
jgi:hypothetical protein